MTATQATPVLDVTFFDGVDIDADSKHPARRPVLDGSVTLTRFHQLDEDAAGAGAKGSVLHRSYDGILSMGMYAFA